MVLFYESVILSILTFSAIVWFYSLDKQNMKKVTRISRTADRIIGAKISRNVEDVVNSAMSNKLDVIISDVQHPLNRYLAFSRTGRMLYPRMRTNRIFKSFLLAL